MGRGLVRALTTFSCLNSLIGGHEGAGYIVAMNDDQTDLKVGQNVGIKWIAHSCNVSTTYSYGHEE